MRVERGITRTVLLAGRWAVKFPSLRKPRLWSFCRGVIANQSEWDWRKWEGVCPPVWTLAGLVSVYPRCAPAPAGMTEEQIRAVGCPTPTDPKPHNLGWLNGRLVWLDYDGSWNDCRRCNGPCIPPQEEE